MSDLLPENDTSSYVSFCHYRTCAAILSRLQSKLKGEKKEGPRSKTGYVRQTTVYMKQ